MSNLFQQDQHQRKLALDPRQSFIVQAPAGSGKTELIIQRILTLLVHVKKPEEILAITFTKKSAHEMRARVLKALDQAMHQPEPDKPHEKLTWKLADAVLKRDQELQWNLITNPNQLQIKTIDSFCTFLTGQLPLLSHFGSQPDISTYAYNLYREAVLEVLALIEEDNAWSSTIARLLEHADNDANKLVDLLISMLQKRDQWQKHLFSNLNMSEGEWRQLLSSQIASVINIDLEHVAACYPENLEEELLSLLRFAAESLINVVPDSKIAALRDITQMPAGDAEHLDAWQAIAEFLLNDDNEWRKKVMPKIGFPALKYLEKSEEPFHRAQQQRYKTLVENLKESSKLHTALTAIRILAPAGYNDSQWETLKDLLEVLKITLAHLRLTFQLHGQIDFIENAEAASLALGEDNNPTDLALSLDYQIKHILVDEFQDTSHTQYRLLEKLTYGWQQHDGRTLFVVGDPMQSIYRFRQAEVGIFIRMQEKGIGDLELTPLRLAVNFRSTPEIVEWNNRQFSAIFPPSSDIATGAVEYSDSTANETDHNNDHTHITLKGFLEGTADAQAHDVIHYIHETLAKYPNEKIAILVRSRPHLTAIIPALKAAGLRYNALEIDPLITRQCIQDCLALTRALIHPADRIAWLAVLRAPWCGLTLSDLLLLCSQNKSAMIWEQLQSDAARRCMSIDGQDRINRILPILETAIQNRDRTGIRQWVENTWLALGGPATLSEFEEMADVTEFFELLAELSGNAQRINLEILNERITELRASTHHDDAPIHIMTVHSAKGLEFDTVILPHLEKANAKDDPSLLLWMDQPLQDDQTALLLAPLHAAGSKNDPLYSYIESLQKIKSRFEVDRLFYVAATRAKKRLHLVFNVKDKESAVTKGSFLAKLWPLIEKQISLTADDETNHPASHHHERKPHAINRFTSKWVNPASIDLPSEHSSYQNKNGFQLYDHSPRIIGTVTHRVFQVISQHSIDWWQHQTSDARFAFFKRQLEQAGIAPKKVNDAATDVSNIIERALQDERGRWILAAHAEARSEYQLTIQHTDGCENIIIDRTFIDANGIRWIIDYKTAVNQDDQLDLFLQKQKQQYAPQLEKYQLALKAIDSKPIKSGLYFPAIPAWCEW